MSTNAFANSGIRPATPGDIAALVAIENASFPGDRLDRRRFRYLLREANSVTFVDVDGAAVRGYILLLLRTGWRGARVYSIATHPAHLGCGVAARLLTAAERWAAAHGCVQVRLEVRADNAASLALFRGRGYVAFGSHGAYYHDGMDALRLRRMLAL
ncbi:ribosomal protein S18 acetylase RimI-like enzyme [Massilia aurea]|uniref:Ribosomal protein S18 acetylase RimI-like enzyme n=1 Tax=Massilia aurea TaxID=373040 RepID=A0A7X0CGI6_9BURK|nr:ribosomal protein S18 acetylase RimI-like enzyme [Massilia aurea]